MGRKPVELVAHAIVRDWEDPEKKYRMVTSEHPVTKTVFANSLRDRGYAVKVVFYEADYKKAKNKEALKGPARLSDNEQWIVDKFEQMKSDKYGDVRGGA